MSTLKVNRIEPRVGDTLDIVGLDIPIKAYGAVKKTTGFSILNSTGFSSIVDNGVGSFICNFSTPVPTNSYSIAGCSNNLSSSETVVFHAANRSQNSFTVYTQNVSVNRIDTDYAGFMVAI